MPNQDPEFVRLASRLSGGLRADTYGSGWSISGMDVRRFPSDNREAARYVRAELNAGRLEPASQAEWDEVHDTALMDAVEEMDPEYRLRSGIQEARLQAVAAKSRRKLEAARQQRAEDDEDYEAPEDARQRRLQERLDEQEEADLPGDDPEEQKAHSTGERARKTKKAAKSR